MGDNNEMQVSSASKRPVKRFSDSNDSQNQKIPRRDSGDVPSQSTKTFTDLPRGLISHILSFVTLTDRLCLRLVSKEFSEVEVNAWVSKSGVDLGRHVANWYPSSRDKRSSYVYLVIRFRRLLKMYRESNVVNLVNWNLGWYLESRNGHPVVSPLLYELKRYPMFTWLRQVRLVNLCGVKICLGDIHAIAQVFPNLEVLICEMRLLCRRGVSKRKMSEKDAVELWQRLIFGEVKNLIEVRIVLPTGRSKVFERSAG